MLRVDTVSFSYDKRLVLDDISFTLQEGQTASLLGINGSGKTTLLRVISGLIKPKNGNVYIKGKNIKHFTGLELARTIAYIPQKTLAISCSVFDAVLMGRKPYIGIEATSKDMKIVEEILILLHLEDYAFRLTTELSGGELQKVIIGRALAQQPKILLLDEPLNHLDIKNQIEVLTLIDEITNKFEITTLAVIHDINNALRFSDKFILLKAGKVHAIGGREVMTEDTIKTVFNINVTKGEVNKIPVIVPILS